MSYSRRGRDSDVSVYEHVDGYWCCELCTLAPEHRLAGRSVRASTPAAMFFHLLRHRRAGDKVPQGALDALRDELKNAPGTG